MILGKSFKHMQSELGIKRVSQKREQKEKKLSQKILEEFLIGDMIEDK